MKRLSGSIICILFFLQAFSQLQSPEQFLGYKPGEKFTPHWRIVEYFKHVAAQAPSVVKLENYGTTYEGRPLMVAYVSTAANISNLESIRENNLRLAASLDNSRGNVQNASAVVWLSYNVHGNEASSSEVSMQAIYELADPSKNTHRQWLENTMIIIDPCLNPDGRDRYVNWYNTVIGKNYDPSLDARERYEPWPGGRSNHYNFDLNRDWAWQTQIESQQRLKLYNRWLPQVHVDFHEQYYDAPYYFAPAAEPFHEVITKWQRDFQHTIGRNHAKIFDEKGWLYFTRERFDLLYPSYGDTYPTFNGSIGMTYEQAGHGMGGLGINLPDGDTLTLVDRVAHHLATTMSTIEVASKNAGQLVSEFQKYFSEATGSGIGNYKSYVIKRQAADIEKIKSLLNLLDKNNIRYGTGRAANARGFNYDTGREENFSVAADDIIISAIQPKGALVKVLFEPRSALADSLTYDITAWAMPYAYGLKAYASNQRMDAGGAVSFPAVQNQATDPYAYVIRWDGVNAAKLVGKLLQKGIRLRVSDEPFESGGQKFTRGSVIIMRTGNQYVQNFWQTVRQAANENNTTLYAVQSGMVDRGYDFGSSLIRSIKPKRIAMITGEGVSSLAAGEVWYYFDHVLDYPVTLINSNRASSGIKWNDYDVVILPNGNYRFLNDKITADAFKNWISAGGSVIALEGAVAQMSKLDWSIKSKKEDTPADSGDNYGALRRYEDREREFLPNVTPGSIFRVELDNTHPLAYGYPNYYYTLKSDDSIYEFVKEGGWNVGVIKKDKQVAGFVGSRLQKRLQDGLLFGVQEIGRGQVTYFADDVLFRSFWENGKLMFANAIFLVGQ
jgi:hypothetical protein